MIDFEAMRNAYPLPTVAGAQVRLRQVGREWVGCCPFHADRSPSFTIFSSGQRFYCFGCGAGGDVLDYVRRIHSVGVIEAAEMLDGGTVASVEIELPSPLLKDVSQIEKARALWHRATPVQGTLADTYLRSRGLRLPIPNSIRFTSLRYGKAGPEHPVLLAAITSVNGQVVGIQRTYLNATGTGKASVPKPKLSLGMVSGGAIRLAPSARALIVCEGLEDGLTLQQELCQPVWVAAGASMLPAMLFPEDVRFVAIGGDADDAGRTSSRKAGEAFTARGLEATTFFPSKPYKDFNDQLRVTNT